MDSIDREFLTAILEALDLPYPAAIGDSEKYRQLLESHVVDTIIVVRDGVHGRGTGLAQQGPF